MTITPIISATDAKALIVKLEARTRISSKGLDGRSVSSMTVPVLGDLLPGAKFAKKLFSAAQDTYSLALLLSRSRRMTVSAFLNQLIVDEARREVST
ncbi:MAG TPA: hypothetical protein VJR92_13785 [Gemmatimonadaceae bacterium]|nr:hypothetical protein [Gemmatimonadaceae bacterium]